MQALDRWVSWSPDKAPRQLNGRLASSTNPNTWTSWRQVSTVKRRGFVLNGDGIVCLDLDHCLEEGKLTGWAELIVAACAGTYVEVSPSGTGLHIFGRGEVGRARKIRDGRYVEVYGSERYMTVTGVRFGDCPSVLADIGAALPV
jgi:primase-polymerase (primpol)-like protein